MHPRGELERVVERAGLVQALVVLTVRVRVGDDPGAALQVRAAVREHDYAGAIGPSNGLEDQIPGAAREIAAHGRDDIVFLIAGDGKSLPVLRERTADLPNVRLVGSVPKQDVPALTRTADVLLTLFADVPILATNSPNKFFDALASGRPVIVNQPGWTRSLVLDNDAGLAVPDADGRALAEAVIALADDPDRRARMGRNARLLAEREFGRDELADRLLNVLKGVSGPGGS